MKLLTVATFCYIAVLTCADKVKDASSLNNENGAVNHAERARSLLAPDTLPPGAELTRGRGLGSQNNRSHLDMQQDGNLVLYRTDDNKPIWHSNTWYSFLGSPGGVNAIMQTDGNFVVYSYEGTALWA
jgi:hypothetical protein